MYTIGTKHFSYTFAPDGKNVAFTDLNTGVNHIAENSYCAYLTDQKKNIRYPVSAVFRKISMRKGGALCRLLILWLCEKSLQGYFYIPICIA